MRRRLGRRPATQLLSTPRATREIGRALGALLEPGDFVALFGELGAGKTLLVRGAAAGAAVPASEPVSSPTFALANVYRGGRVVLQHIDLYRVAGPDELVALGFQEWLAAPAATLCEWPEHAGALLPRDRLELRLGHHGPRSRTLELRPLGPRARLLARALWRRAV
jgi:tRNA threonylcarbamoyladenosine biosynthesis protein TsaE